MIRATLLTGALLLACTLPARAEDTADRVITLGGSITEIAVALGARDRLVGRDTTSNYPPEIEELPDVGYIRALSPEGVLSMSPGLVIAEGDAGPPEAVAVLKETGIPFVIVPDDPSPAGIAAKIRAVAAPLGLTAEGEALAAQVTEGLAAAEARAAAVTSRKSVLFLLSVQGGRIMAGGDGTAAAAIIGLAGGDNAATGFAGYKQITDEAIIATAPDVILMMARTGDLAIQTQDIQTHPALSQTPAAKAGAIVAMDGMLLLGFGPRTPEAAEALYTVLYPQND